MTLNDDKKLECKHCFDTYNTSSTKNYKGVNGYSVGNENYVGQGNHNMTVADVDNDGKDEFISGAMCMEINDNDKLVPRWCTFLGHGDAMHIGDYDPLHDGMEFFTVHEEGGGYVESFTGKTLDYGMSVLDASTGEIIYHEGADKDTGRGMMANVGAGGYYQIQSARNSAKLALGNTSFTNANMSMSVNFRVFWDADLYDELLDGVNITSWNGSSMARIFNAAGCKQINGTKANPALQADLFGDWREEVCYPTSDDSAVRVFTTTDVTTYKLPTLMHDPVYRSGVAAEQTAYNQPPHIGFYLSDELYRAKLTGIDVTAPDKTVYQIGEALDTTGMAVTGSYDDGTNYDLTGYSVTGFDNMKAGIQKITVNYRGFEKTFEVEVLTGFTCDADGMITGYDGNSDTAIIPESINGVEVTGISALDSTVIKKLYVYENVENIENNVFSGIKVYCYEGSAMHLYAVDNEVDFELIERNVHDYIINEDFGSNAYTSFGIYQDKLAQTAIMGKITYGVGGRNRGGDGTSGFGVEDNNGNAYLRCGVGQFATNGRNSYMNIADAPMISSSYDNVFAFDFIIPYTLSKANSEVNAEPYANISDSGNVVDELSIDNLGIEYDKWYGYSLIYHGNSYYRVLKNTDGNIISITKLGAANADTGISKIEFLQCAKSIQQNAFGKGSNSYIGIDNLQTYSAETAISDINIQILDRENNAVEDASVTIGNMTVKTDFDGMAECVLPAGIYQTSIKADGYVGNDVTLAIYKREYAKKLVIDREVINAEAISVEEKASVAIGGTIKLNALTQPLNATTRDFVWSSSNENAATVDSNGIVTGVSEGSTEIKVKLGELESVCQVTVYDTSKYEQVPAKIKIVDGAEKVYIPSSGTNSTVVFNALVYDANDVIIDDAKVTWSADKAEIKDGILSVASSTEPGTMTITASLGDISASVTAELVSVFDGTDMFAKLDYTDCAEVNLHQGTENKELTVGDVTFGSGARGGGGNSSIGVWATEENNGNVYMTGGSSAWSSDNRNSYVTFNKAPSSYAAGVDYVFETDIRFMGSTSITFSNGITISPSLCNMIARRWYHYILIYSNGQYTQYVFDSSNKLIDITVLTNNSSEPINRINFGISGEEGKVNFDNTYYYAKENALSNLKVTVSDINGNAITNAEVSVGGVNANTNTMGNATFALPTGVYTVAISVNGENIMSKQIMHTKKESISYVCEELPPEPTQKPEFDFYITVEEADNSISAKLNTYDGVTPSEMPVLYTALYKDGHLVSVVSGDGVTVNTGNADEYKCFALYKNGIQPASKAYCK